MRSKRHGSTPGGSALAYFVVTRAYTSCKMSVRNKSGKRHVRGETSEQLSELSAQLWLVATVDNYVWAASLTNFSEVARSCTN